MPKVRKVVLSALGRALDANVEVSQIDTERVREVVLNQITSSGVAAALVSGYALLEVDWMPDIESPAAIAASLCFFWSSHLGIFSTVAAAALYRKANQFQGDMAAWRVKHHRQLGIPWWTFLFAALFYLAGQLASSFKAGHAFLMVIGVGTFLATVLGAALYVLAVSDDQQAQQQQAPSAAASAV